MNKQIKIMVVDDHQIVRSGLVAVLNAERDLTVVAEASSGREAIEIFPRHRPDVTVIDMRLPEMDGPETITTIRRQFPCSKFVVLSSYDLDTDIYRATQAGASGYLLKGMFNSEFIQAIRLVSGGLRYFPARIAERLSSCRIQSELTCRELEVLTLLAQGKSNKEIGATLKIAESTVRWFLTIIYGKLEVRDRAQAITNALRRGLVNLEGASLV
jgi:DNA-binding NarL/FixJ family response regulator